GAGINHLPAEQLVERWTCCPALHPFMNKTALPPPHDAAAAQAPRNKPWPPNRPFHPMLVAARLSCYSHDRGAPPPRSYAPDRRPHRAAKKTAHAGPEHSAILRDGRRYRWRPPVLRPPPLQALPSQMTPDAPS